MPHHSTQPTKDELESSARAINLALADCPDKEWNYSRINLLCSDLSRLDSPYVLWCDRVDLHTKEGRSNYRACLSEVDWGERHSSELGVLEIISLRINKALLESTDDEYWQMLWPIIRIIEKQELVSNGITVGFWYEVQEVAGKEFDSR